MAAQWTDSYGEGGRRCGGGRGDVSFGFEGAWLPVVKYILIANVVVYLLQLIVTVPPTLPAGIELTPEEMRFIPRDSVVQNWLEFDTAKVLQGQIWRVVTGSFCHDRESIFHILFNMLFLVWFGRKLESRYGSREFALFYGCAAILSSIAYMLVELTMGDQIPMIGASGAVLGVLMLYTMHHPREKLYIWFVIPVELRWVTLAYVVFDLYPVLRELGGDKIGDGVAHAAHLGGLAFGFLYYHQNLRLEPLWLGLVGKRQSRSKSAARSKGGNQAPKPQAARLPHSKEVDRILDKITSEGLHSLSEEEREILNNQSNQFRNRP